MLSDVFFNMIKYLSPFYFFLICIGSLFEVSCNQNESASSNEKEYNFNDVAPILYAKCSTCHRPGSGAPFNLITYADIKSHLLTSQLAINERLMPPWPADTNFSRFRDEKVMTKEQIQIINTWISQGAPEGTTENLPPFPEFREGSYFGKPDLVIRSSKPFVIKGNNLDNFIMMKIPHELPADTFIRAIEIIPDNKKLVHHINGHLVQYEWNDKSNTHSGAEYVNSEIMSKRQAYEKLNLANDDGTYPLLSPSVTNYLPGVGTAIYPKGIGGYRVKKKGVLLLDNIHYGPSPVDTTDQTTFNIFFSPTQPVRPTFELIVGTSGIAPVSPPLIIPANQIKTFTARYRLPQAISILTINPHMHLLGASFKAYAVTASQDTIRIINIPKWDFRWQYFYTFPKMKVIPAGSFIITEGVFDNTENNPLNPFHPPRQISEREGSMRTTDEMFQLICTYLPYQPGDENISLENEKFPQH